MTQSQEQFDEWFRQYIQNTHGIDITGELPPATELLFEWQAGK
jgi:hypothetical protein